MCDGLRRQLQLRATCKRASMGVQGWALPVLQHLGVQEVLLVAQGGKGTSHTADAGAVLQAGQVCNGARNCMISGDKRIQCH